MLICGINGVVEFSRIAEISQIECCSVYDLHIPIKPIVQTLDENFQIRDAEPCEIRAKYHFDSITRKGFGVNRVE